MNQGITKFLQSNSFKMLLGIILLILITATLLKTCSTPKALTQKDLKLKEYEQKVKLYEDSLLVVNKALQKTNIIKDTLYEKHVEYRTKIIIQKEQLVLKQIDTLTLLNTLDSAFTNCDSLNKVNDTIIDIQKNKIEVLDSIISTQEYKEAKMKEDLTYLNKSLKKQKRQSTGKTIGYSVLGISIGLGAGLLIGIFK